MKKGIFLIKPSYDLIMIDLYKDENSLTRHKGILALNARPIRSLKRLTEESPGTTDERTVGKPKC